MTTQHTPGPWQATQNLDAGSYGPSWTIRLDKQVIVASVSGAALHCGAETAEANARLIAAAPDMLEALNAIVARINGEWDHPALVAYGPLDMQDDDCLAIARAAIAKATQP